MNFIEKVLMKSYKRTMAVYNVFAFGCMFILLCAILEELKVEGIKMIIIMSIIIICYIIIYILIKKYLVSRFKFENTKMYKILEKRGYNKQEFFDVLNSEINSKKTIKYYNDTYKAGLIMTETWFVFISYIKPEIRKTCEINKISEELLEDSDEYGTFKLVIEFKDKTIFSTSEVKHDIEEIQNKIKMKYPNILIGHGIIDNQ